MDKKIYKVFVTQQVSTYLDIVSDTEEGAEEIVKTMLLNGEVEFDDFSCDQRIEIDESHSIKETLEEIKKSIENENISYGEIAQLQALKEYIKNDVVLMEWAGIPED